MRCSPFHVCCIFKMDLHINLQASHELTVEWYWFVHYLLFQIIIKIHVNSSILYLQMKSAGQSLLTERLCNERNYMVIPDIIIVAQGITFTVSEKENLFFQAFNLGPTRVGHTEYLASHSSWKMTYCCSDGSFEDQYMWIATLCDVFLEENTDISLDFCGESGQASPVPLPVWTMNAFRVWSIFPFIFYLSLLLLLLNSVLLSFSIIITVIWSTSVWFQSSLKGVCVLFLFFFPEGWIPAVS